MRDSTVLEPDSCAKKRRATIAFAHPLAARASLPFECSADRPFAARSPFRRQRMAAVSAPPFEADGSAAVLAQAAVPGVRGGGAARRAGPARRSRHAVLLRVGGTIFLRRQRGGLAQGLGALL